MLLLNQDLQFHHTYYLLQHEPCLNLDRLCKIVSIWFSKEQNSSIIYLSFNNSWIVKFDVNVFTSIKVGFLVNLLVYWQSNHTWCFFTSLVISWMIKKRYLLFLHTTSSCNILNFCYWQSNHPLFLQRPRKTHNQDYMHNSKYFLLLYVTYLISNKLNFISICIKNTINWHTF